MKMSLYLYNIAHSGLLLREEAVGNRQWAILSAGCRWDGAYLVTDQADVEIRAGRSPNRGQHCLLPTAYCLVPGFRQCQLSRQIDTEIECRDVADDARDKA